MSADGGVDDDNIISNRDTESPEEHVLSTEDGAQEKPAAPSPTAQESHEPVTSGTGGSPEPLLPKEDNSEKEVEEVVTTVIVNVPGEEQLPQEGEPKVVKYSNGEKPKGKGEDIPTEEKVPDK